jgi:hypothetical protein
MIRYVVKSVFGGNGKEALRVMKKDFVTNVVDLKKYYFTKPWL